MTSRWRATSSTKAPVRPSSVSPKPKMLKPLLVNFWPHTSRTYSFRFRTRQSHQFTVFKFQFIFNFYQFDPHTVKYDKFTKTKRYFRMLALLRTGRSHRLFVRSRDWSSPGRGHEPVMSCGHSILNWHAFALPIFTRHVYYFRFKLILFCMNTIFNLLFTHRLNVTHNYQMNKSEPKQLNLRILKIFLRSNNIKHVTFPNLLRSPKHLHGQSSKHAVSRFRAATLESSDNIPSSIT